MRSGKEAIRNCAIRRVRRRFKTRILRDKETGVCYVFHMQGVSSGLTLLVDADGNPVTI
ncbi:DUF6440 family protein [Dietzia maris]